MMWQCCFISCNKCTIQVRNVDNGWGYTCEGRESVQKSVFSSQFSSETKTSLNFICLISIPWCTVQNITGFQGCHIQCRWQDTDICNHVWYSPSPYKSKWTFSFLSELVLWLGINKLPVFWIIPLTIHWQHSWVWSNSTNAQNNHFQWYKPDRTPDFWVICVALLRWQREASLWKIAIVYPLCSHSNNSRYHCHLEEYILTSETLINDPLGGN